MFFTYIKNHKIKIMFLIGLMISASLSMELYKISIHDHFENNKKKLDKKNQILKYSDLSKMEKKSAFHKKIYLNNKKLPAPTNKWFSSVAFKKDSEPMFAYPLVVKMGGNGFGISYPNIISTEKTVFASYAPDIEVSFKKKLSSTVSSYDDLSVEIDEKYGESRVASLRITRGSPFIFLRMHKKNSLEMSFPSLAIKDSGEDYVILVSKNKTFAVFFNQKETHIEINNVHSIKLTSSIKNALLTFAVLPENYKLKEFKQFAMNPILGTKVEFERKQNSFITHFKIITQNNKDTFFSLLPKHFNNFLSKKNSKGEYNTIRGEQKLYEGNEFVINTALLIPQERIDLSRINQVKKETLKKLIKKDVQNIFFEHNDTYFGGKNLYAVANLLDLAIQLKMDDESEIIKNKLRNELEVWKNNTFSLENNKEKYFYYDNSIKGIVGSPSSFGSELFNDHNFHYGYFIYAATVLSRYDRQYFEENKEFINLLVKDIANTDRNDINFAYLRSFDFYEGHSWASGFGLFNDGNNQESSSEAINSWYAVYLWAGLLKNEELENYALWLYNQECISALQYWLNIDLENEMFNNYKCSIVSLLWGGKVDCATWFDNLPESILGIQLIPMNGGSFYLNKDPARIMKNLENIDIKNITKFKDYIIMYQALANTGSALSNLEKVSNIQIDGANTKSYLYAWVYYLNTLNK